MLVLTKLSSWSEDWTLGYNSTKFRDFSVISKFPKIRSLGTWPIYGEQKPSCFVLFFLIYDIHLLFFLHGIHFLYLISCTRKSLFTFPGPWRLASKVSAFRNNLYLQMLLGDTCLLVPSARDFHILSCMLKTASIKFLPIAFCLYFLHSNGIPLRNFNVFLLDVSLLLRLCFNSE